MVHHDWLCTKRRCGARHGFTLVEVLLALVLFLVVSASLYLALRSSMLVYQRSGEGLAVLHSINVTLEHVGRDVRNAFMYEAVPFEGERDTMTFMTVRRVYDAEGTHRELRKVTYHAQEGTLKRRSVAMDGDSEVEHTAHEREILRDHLTAVSWAYGYHEKDAATITWREKWPKDFMKIPRAVKIRLEVTMGTGTPHAAKTIERTFWIPQGTWGEG